MKQILFPSMNCRHEEAFPDLLTRDAVQIFAFLMAVRELKLPIHRSSEEC